LIDDKIFSKLNHIKGDAMDSANLNTIQTKIVEVRGMRVMLDCDLAGLYQVETKVLNQAVKRNMDSFPDDFLFRLTENEFDYLKSQSVTSSWGGTRKLPFVFTEYGCIQASTVLKSKAARTINIFVVRAFVALKNQITSNPNYALLNERLKRLESETKRFNSKAAHIQSDMNALTSDHAIDINVQNMEIDSLNNKMDQFLHLFNQFKDHSIVIKKYDDIGDG
jgi:hypothetical protein